MSSDPQKMLDVLFAIFSLAVEFGCLAFFVILFCLTWRYVFETWRRGLLAGVVTFLLALPAAIAGVCFLDVHRAMPDVPAGREPIVRIAVGVMALGILLMMVPLRAIYYHVAAYEWGMVRNTPGPTLAGPPRSALPALVVGAGVGAVTLALTFIIFHAAHVGERQSGDDWLKLFPGLMEMPRILLGIVMASFVSLYAVVEELIFRGGLLGFLLRISGNKNGVAWVSIAFVSLLWALLHYPNTDQPAIKISQIFLMGLAQGAMMRRWGIAPAICAHVTLNAGAVVFSLLFPQLN